MVAQAEAPNNHPDCSDFVQLLASGGRSHLNRLVAGGFHRAIRIRTQCPTAEDGVAFGVDGEHLRAALDAAFEVGE
jgi:hypothetical protein